MTVAGSREVTGAMGLAPGAASLYEPRSHD